MRRVVADALLADGHEVVEARDGLELLDEIEASIRKHRHDRFALIITDVRMPELSGLDVLGALACAAWHTPVIVMTAFPSDETRVEARELGAVRLLEKPFELDELRAAVAHALREA
jgi:DNA-binding response OmpR family regulator